MPYDVSPNALASALSSLPTLGAVSVSRFGPTSLQEFTWSITFTSHPGNLKSCEKSPHACLGVHASTPTAINVGGAGCQNVNGTYVDDHDTINGRMVRVSLDYCSYVLSPIVMRKCGRREKVACRC